MPHTSPATNQPTPPSTPKSPHAFLASYKPARSHFSSFCVMPKQVRFETQEEGEEIILLLRRHPITNLSWILIALFLLFGPIIVIPISNLGGLIGLLDSISTELVPVLLAFWYLATIGFIIMNFFFWYFNVNIVTNSRIIDIDFFYLLYREFSEALLSKIEDVTAIGGGILGAIFDYGNVEIQTAAATDRIEFQGVPKPQEVVRIITNLAAKP